MSSLAAARADNFYFPPEWRPEMGGISKFQGSKGANQYEKYGIIRFEMPFDTWCLGCNRHNNKGLRFNAKKNRAGNYFSTPIWSFIMKCYSCEQEFDVRTDPEHRTYNMVSGLRAMEQDYTVTTEDSVEILATDEDRQKLALDPMFRLEHEIEDKAKAASAKEVITMLQDRQEALTLFDYEANSLLRRKHRAVKAKDKQLAQEGKERGLGISLLELTEEDKEEAAAVRYRSKASSFTQNKRAKRIDIMSEPMFKTKSTRKSSAKNAIELKRSAAKLKVKNQIDGKNFVLAESAKVKHVPPVAKPMKSALNILTTSYGTDSD